jgi:hypothetical protein
MPQALPVFEVQEAFTNLAAGGGSSEPFKWHSIEVDPRLTRRWLWILFDPYDLDTGAGEACICVGHLRFFLESQQIAKYTFQHGTQTKNNAEEYVLTPVSGGGVQPTMRYGYSDLAAPFKEHYITVAPLYLEIECDRIDFWQDSFTVFAGAFQIVRALRVLSMRPE